MTQITIIRHQTTGNVLSVYLGTPHLGLVFCPVPGSHSDYIARPAAPYCDAVPDASFATEEEAIDYLERAPGT